MRTSSLVYIIIALLFLSSCRKNKIVTEQIEDINTWLAKVKDSCSYTIDGRVYICEQGGGRGAGNSGMNLDTSNGQYKWHPDSLLYYTQFSFNTYKNGNSDTSYLKLIFTKKYSKNQLFPRSGILAPATDLDLYGMGRHKFSTEFKRFNSDEGVVLSMEKWTGSTFERFSTNTDTPYSWPTTLNPQSHNNSEFEIIKVIPLPYGYKGHIIEARFSANIYNKNEQVSRVENGYVRFGTGD